MSIFIEVTTSNASSQLLMIYLYNLRLLKDVYIGKGEQHSKPSYTIGFNVIEYSRIHYYCNVFKRFKIMDFMVEQVASISEAQAFKLEIQDYSMSEVRSRLLTQNCSAQSVLLS